MFIASRPLKNPSFVRSEKLAPDEEDLGRRSNL
jgi:hypothetical protein